MKFSKDKKTIIWVMYADIDSDGVCDIPARAIEPICCLPYSRTTPPLISVIDDGAFCGLRKLKKVSIPDTVNEIGKKAFKICHNLVDVSLPKNLTRIRSEMFYDCINLERINIPSTVKNIESEAFYHCSNLIEVDIPDGVTEISASTFRECDMLTRINIPDSVTSIGAYAFSKCNSLQSISLPKKLKVIDWSAFYSCKSLKGINVSDGVIAISTSAFEDCENLRKIDLPNSLTILRDGAFRGCKKLTSLKLPDNLTHFSFSSVEKCFNLKTIVFPSTIETIAGEPSGLAKLKDLVIPGESFERIKQLLPEGLTHKAIKKSFYNDATVYIKNALEGIAIIPQLNALYNAKNTSGYLYSEDVLGQINLFLPYKHKIYQIAKSSMNAIPFPHQEDEVDRFRQKVDNAYQFFKSEAPEANESIKDICSLFSRINKAGL